MSFRNRGRASEKRERGGGGGVGGFLFWKQGNKQSPSHAQRSRSLVRLPSQQRSKSAKSPSRSPGPSGRSSGSSARSAGPPIRMNSLPSDFNNEYTSSGSFGPSSTFSVTDPKPSSLKIATLNESLHATSSLRSFSPRKQVAFGQIGIQEYARTYGDNPSCSSGVPITIGWEHTSEIVLPVDVYESERSPRKSQHELVLKRDERHEMLLYEWNVPQTQIVAAIRATQKAKNQRRQTVVNLGPATSGIEEVAERVKRKAKRFVLFAQATPDSEAVMLTEKSRKAQIQRSHLIALEQESKSSEQSSRDTDDEIDHLSMFSGETYAERSYAPSPSPSISMRSKDAYDDHFSVGSGTTLAEKSYVAPPTWRAMAVASPAAAMITTPVKDKGAHSEEGTKSTVALDDSTPGEKTKSTLSPWKASKADDFEVPVPPDDQEQAPMFANLPSPDEIGSGSGSSFMEDDDVSQLTDTDFFSIKTDVINERKRVMEDANRRYQEGKGSKGDILVSRTPAQTGREPRQKDAADSNSGHDDNPAGVFAAEDDEDDEEFSA